MNFASTNIAPQPLTEIYLLAWLNQAEVGDAIEYHRGSLAFDRSSRGQARSENDRITLDHLATLAMRLANRGLVHLIQRRIGPDRYGYLAIAGPRSESTPLSFLMPTSKENV
jgi:hypothetical protein